MPLVCTIHSECPSWFKLTAGTTDSTTTYPAQCLPVSKKQTPRSDEGSSCWNDPWISGKRDISILQDILPSGPYVYPHTSLVIKHFLFAYHVPINMKTRRVLPQQDYKGREGVFTKKGGEINILDQGIILFNESLACINSSPFPLKTSYWNRYRLFGTQDFCIFKRLDFLASFNLRHSRDYSTLSCLGLENRGDNKGDHQEVHRRRNIGSDSQPRLAQVE